MCVCQFHVFMVSPNICLHNKNIHINILHKLEATSVSCGNSLQPQVVQSSSLNPTHLW